MKQLKMKTKVSHNKKDRSRMKWVFIFSFLLPWKEKSLEFIPIWKSKHFSRSVILQLKAVPLMNREKEMWFVWMKFLPKIEMWFLCEMKYILPKDRPWFSCPSKSHFWRWFPQRPLNIQTNWPTTVDSVSKFLLREQITKTKK